MDSKITERYAWITEEWYTWYDEDEKIVHEHFMNFDDGSREVVQHMLDGRVVSIVRKGGGAPSYSMLLDYEDFDRFSIVKIFIDGKLTFRQCRETAGLAPDDLPDQIVWIRHVSAEGDVHMCINPLLVGYVSEE